MTSPPRRSDFYASPSRQATQPSQCISPCTSVLVYFMIFLNETKHRKLILIKVISNVLCLLCIWLNGVFYFQLYLNDRLSVSYSRVLKFFLQSGLLIVSLVCGILRFYDNKHHLSDVIVGFGIGVTVAVAVVSIAQQKSMLHSNRTKVFVNEYY